MSTQTKPTKPPTFGEVIDRLDECLSAEVIASFTPENQDLLIRKLEYCTARARKCVVNPATGTMMNHAPTNGIQNIRQPSSDVISSDEESGPVEHPTNTYKSRRPGTHIGPPHATMNWVNSHGEWPEHGNRGDDSAVYANGSQLQGCEGYQDNE